MPENVSVKVRPPKDQIKSLKKSISIEFDFRVFHYVLYLESKKNEVIFRNISGSLIVEIFKKILVLGINQNLI